MNVHTKVHGKHGDFAIEARSLVKRFKSGKAWVDVLKGVDFDARHGDLTMVMGPSGSGKSTLIAALSGLLKPEEGRVDALDVDDLWKLSSGRIDKFRLDNCGFIFQGFNLFPALTALQQVETVLKFQGLTAGQAKKRAAAVKQKAACGGGRRYDGLRHVVGLPSRSPPHPGWAGHCSNLSKLCRLVNSFFGG